MSALRHAILPLLLVLLQSLPRAALGQAAGSACVQLPPALKVDTVWGGTKVWAGTVETDASVYVGYYDEERWLAVAEISKCKGTVRKVRIGSRFEGWDAHNLITLALDDQGLLHVAGNMHVSPLVYARMSRPGDLESLQQLRPQTGQSEDRTTYPSFFRFPDGALGFSYREGASGDGQEIINRFDGQRWRRWLDKPLFAPSRRGGDHVSAYRSDYVRGSDGYFHVAWVWRRNYKVETNFHVNYAKSRDLKTWFDSKGRSLSVPLTPDNAEVVDPVPEGNGLLNNVRLGLDGAGRPVISYLKFDASGNSQLWHARLEQSGWRLSQSTQWSYRWDPRGGGTIPIEIAFSGVQWRDGMLLENIRQPQQGNAVLRYDPESLVSQGPMKGYAWVKMPKVARTAPRGTTITIQPVAAPANSASAASGYAISWAGMPADTRDKPRVCKPEIADCRYVFDLELHRP